jgi:hypothetical protein
MTKMSTTQKEYDYGTKAASRITVAIPADQVSKSEEGKDFLLLDSHQRPWSLYYFSIKLKVIL